MRTDAQTQILAWDEGGGNTPGVGTQVAIIVSGAICIVWTLIAPDRNASWAQLRADLRDRVEVHDDSEVRLEVSGMCSPHGGDLPACP